MARDWSRSQSGTVSVVLEQRSRLGFVKEKIVSSETLVIEETELEIEEGEELLVEEVSIDGLCGVY
jgi:mycofactocin precursor